MLSRTQTLYGVTNAFLDIAGNPLQKPQDELAALQWSTDPDGGLAQLKLLFGKRIPVMKNDRLITKFAYFPVEIHFPSGEIILKANRNIEGLKEKPYTYTSLALEYLERVAQLFQRRLAATNIENLRKMYEVSRYLTRRYFQAVSEEQGDPLQALIDSVSSQIQSGIRIVGLTEKTRVSDIFDIHKNVRYIIENAKLFDYITSHPDQRPILCRLDGFLTYIKYEDRDAYLIRFRGANYTRDLSNSETFLRLRGDLEKYKAISTIQVFWFREHGDYANKFRVRYEVFSPEVLALYFYSELNEDDFRDAVEKFNRYGKGGTA